jgi:hypothetical protein
VGRLELGVEAADVLEELGGEVVAGLLDRRRWRDAGEEPVHVRRVDLLGDAATGEFDQQGVHAAHEAGAVVADVGVALREQPQDLAVAGGFDPAQTRGPQGRDRDRGGVVGVVLVRPARGQDPNPRRQRRRHVETVSPAATSCWASR